MKRETLTVAAAEVRFATDDVGVFSGYAAIFTEPNSFGETIRPGAFKKTLLQRRSTGGPAMFWNHNPDAPIGTWSDLVEDDRGLKVTGKLVTETRAGAEALALLKAGAVNGLSIGFRARGAARAPDGGRLLTDIDLVEISLVSLPAASNARVTSVRSAPAGFAAFTEAARRTATVIRGLTK
jgi:HK97 family phage prohead protease